MQKIPTVFRRDDKMHRIVNECVFGCEWVLRGEGVATQKYDGTCCLVRAGKLYKRHEVKPGQVQPAFFEQTGEIDPITGKLVGWVPVGDGPNDKYHREAFAMHAHYPDGTYELLGPKIQGNPEQFPTHCLVAHAVAVELPSCPRTFDGIREFLEPLDIEGIVFHHSDGRMAKVKKRDYGLPRRPA